MEEIILFHLNNSAMKKFIFLIIFVNIYINTFAQDPVNNMIKYWNYRNRLKYFVIPGTKQGESEVIGIRNDMSLWPPSIPSDTLYKIIQRSIPE